MDRKGALAALLVEVTPHNIVISYRHFLQKLPLNAGTEDGLPSPLRWRV
jgi:hypothetical protein